MFDCHYDLLTYIYSNRDNIPEIKKHCNNIFNNNITGGIFNLFYMSPQEMYYELKIRPDEINVIKNLEKVIDIIYTNKLIPYNINYSFGIEGLDYLENIDDIDILYNLGVRSVNPVWNNHNKFGTGVKPIKIINNKRGLTEEGKKLIKKLIYKQIAIDVSHSDEETFWDIIKIARDFKKLRPKIWASHSNCKALCDTPRNLTDDQIMAIHEFKGTIGIVGIKQFCSIKQNENYEEKFIEHINHIRNMLNGVEHIGIASDDMSYYKIKPEYYKTINVFKYENMCSRLIQLMKENKYNDDEIYKIVYKKVIV